MHEYCFVFRIRTHCHSVIVLWKCISTHTHTTILWLCGFCLGQPGWAGTRRNIHSRTPIVVINRSLSASSIYFDPWHPPNSINPHALQSFSTISLQVFFGLPVGLAPSTSYSIHFFTQWLSYFRNTCPYHCNLFLCSIEIMSSYPSLSLKPLLEILSCSFTTHIHLTIVISGHWSSTSFSFLMGRSHFHATYYFTHIPCLAKAKEPLTPFLL